jgi:Late competence development protein ComFB
MVQRLPAKEKMESCRNLLLDLIVREIHSQGNGGRLQQQTGINEIAIYTLNQLPPVYVATEKDWQIQIDLAQANSRLAIEDAVHYAIENLWINPQRNYAINPAEQELPARALLLLQKQLGMQNLTWKQLPTLLRLVLEQKLANRTAPTLEQSELSEEYQSYILPAKFYCFNALRLPVTRLIIQKLRRFPSEIASKTRLEEIVAMALNQLPPMYGSNEGEITALRQRAKVELGSKFERVVDLVVQSAKKDFFDQRSPLLFEQIKTERREAMDTLKLFFQDPQVNWRSCPDYVENALVEAAQGKVVWQT